MKFCLLAVALTAFLMMPAAAQTRIERPNCTAGSCSYRTASLQCAPGYAVESRIRQRGRMYTWCATPHGVQIQPSEIIFLPMVLFGGF